MTFDQKILIWNTLGTWLAAIATLGAVIVALYLSAKSEQLKVDLRVGVRKIIQGTANTPERCICFEVTNAGLHPITVTNFGWIIGKGRRRRLIHQNPTIQYSSSLPIELAYGKQATFLISFAEAPNWLSEFRNNLDKEHLNSDLRSIKAFVYTSIGKSVEMKPEANLLEFIRHVQLDA
jgi:hypothetical protein